MKLDGYLLIITQQLESLSKESLQNAAPTQGQVQAS
jgi:hypothetical protein